MITLDYSQHKCPYPVVETRKQMLANPGEILIVTVGDKAGRDNVSRLAEKMDYTASSEPAGAGFTLTLTAANQTESPQAEAQAAPVEVSAPTGKTIIYCGSDRMGHGDDEFGRVLMRNFIATQLEMDPLPDMILFVNTAINLTTEGSEVLEALQKLNDQGVDLASCGLCLEFYGKKEQLKVGRVTNMYEMADVQNSAARVICP